MFNRELTRKEEEIIKKIVDFVKIKHKYELGHDTSHVLEVCRWSIEIGMAIKESVDPFVVICGALLHDIGRVGARDGSLHGLDGGSRSEKFLESLIDDNELIRSITKVVVRHTPTSMLEADTFEGKVVCDADTIERLGFMGMIRGIMGKKGSMESIIEDRIKKRLADYNKLFFKESKKFANPYYKETLIVVNSLEKGLQKRLSHIEDIESYRAILNKVNHCV